MDMLCYRVLTEGHGHDRALVCQACHLDTLSGVTCDPRSTVVASPSKRSHGDTEVNLDFVVEVAFNGNCGGRYGNRTSYIHALLSMPSSLGVWLGGAVSVTVFKQAIISNKRNIRTNIFPYHTFFTTSCISNQQC